MKRDGIHPNCRCVMVPINEWHRRVPYWKIIRDFLADSCFETFRASEIRRGLLKKGRIPENKRRAYAIIATAITRHPEVFERVRRGVYRLTISDCSTENNEQEAKQEERKDFHDEQK